MGAATAVGLGTAALIGGIHQSRQARKAGKRQAEAMMRASDATERQYLQTREDLAPWTRAGRSALRRYKEAVLEGDISGFKESPGYQYQLEQGEKALSRAQAARGRFFSPRAALELQKHGQGLASQEYGNYLARLSGLSQTGQLAAAQTGQFGDAATQQMGQQNIGAASALAQRDMAQSQAFTNFLNVMAPFAYSQRFSANRQNLQGGFGQTSLGSTFDDDLSAGGGATRTGLSIYPQGSPWKR